MIAFLGLFILTTKLVAGALDPRQAATTTSSAADCECMSVDAQIPTDDQSSFFRPIYRMLSRRIMHICGTRWRGIHLCTESIRVLQRLNKRL